MSISIVLDKIPVLDIAILVYKLYDKGKQTKALNRLTELIAEGYDKGKTLFDVLLAAFVRKYKEHAKDRTKTQKFIDFSDKLSGKLVKTIPLAVIPHAIGDLERRGIQWIIKKIKKRDYIAEGIVETYLGKKKLLKYDDGHREIVFEFNEELRQVFRDSMNEYFRFVLADPIINKITNPKEFEEGFFQLIRETKQASPQAFVKFLYFDEPELLKVLGLK